MLSKELLSEVLKKEYNHIEQYGSVICCRNIVDGKLHDGWDINIYELAHKCKEWAFKQGYELFSRILSNDHQPVGNCVVYRVEADPEESLCITNADTEPFAIFKACEWILEQTRGAL